jgi:hypothetical protein
MMTSTTLRVPPAGKAVRLHQIRLVGYGIRREVAAFFAVLAVVWVVQALQAIQARGYSVHNVSVEYSPQLAFPVWWLALLAPLAVWRGEDRNRRTYLWSMPVDTTVNSLLRVFAGWLWVMTLVAVFLLFVNVLTVTQGLLAGDWPYFSARWWEWIIPFTASTIAYTLGSALVVGSKYPVRWLAGAVVAWWALPTLIAMFHAWSVDDLWTMMWSGRGGATVMLTGRWTLERMPNQPASLAQWSVVTAAWLIVAAVLLWLAARRKPE